MAVVLCRHIVSDVAIKLTEISEPEGVCSNSGL